MRVSANLADEYKELLDTLEKEYNGDIVEWANQFLDVEYTIDGDGDLKRLCFQITTGGPDIWLCIDGTDFVTVEIYEAFKEPKKITFTHPMAKEVFGYFDDLLHKTIICRNK